MNAVTHALRRPGRRIAELDPFAAGPDVEPGVDYGCVDWYVYGEEQPPADAPAPRAQPRTEAAGLPLVLPPEPQARARRH